MKVKKKQKFFSGSYSNVASINSVVLVLKKNTIITIHLFPICGKCQEYETFLRIHIAVQTILKISVAAVYLQRYLPKKVTYYPPLFSWCILTKAASRSENFLAWYGKWYQLLLFLPTQKERTSSTTPFFLVAVTLPFFVWLVL